MQTALQCFNAMGAVKNLPEEAQWTIRALLSRGVPAAAAPAAPASAAPLSFPGLPQVLLQLMGNLNGNKVILAMGKGLGSLAALWRKAQSVPSGQPLLVLELGMECRLRIEQGKKEVPKEHCMHPGVQMYRGKDQQRVWSR